MSTRFRVAIIGAGRPIGTEGATGYGMAYGHARGYLATGKCDLVAVADLSPSNGEAFTANFKIPRGYTDYKEMLATEKPDIVSICTWPHLHSPMTLAAAEAGVKAVHCEKPMAPNWGDARAMLAACEKRGVQLTFNHQRRFLEPFQKTRQMIRDGEIGDLVRMEATCGDLIDWGTHWIDMLFFYNEEQPAEWVMGQIDSRQNKSLFGLGMEDQGISYFRFKNGVRATLYTGAEADIGAAIRITGSAGEIEISWGEPAVRVRKLDGAGWVYPEVNESIHDGVGIDRAVANLVDCLETGSEPELSGRKALQTSEVIFATYESSRRRARVDLPLTTLDNAYLSMLEAGEIGAAL